MSNIILSPIEYKKFSVWSETLILKRRHNIYPGSIQSATSAEIIRITGNLRYNARLKINKKKMI